MRPRLGEFDVSCRRVVATVETMPNWCDDRLEPGEVREVMKLVETLTGGTRFDFERLLPDASGDPRRRRFVLRAPRHASRPVTRAGEWGASWERL